MYLYLADAHYNLGDSMQLIALETIYSKMGIDLNKIVRIGWHDLPCYDGEPVILPIVSGIESSFGALRENRQFSSKIRPVYISYVRFNDMDAEDAEYLRQFQPIGCRDEYTYSQCRRFNIKAYINGCITALLPDRAKPQKNGKVFLVDPEPELLQYIPNHLLEDSITMSHIVRSEDDFDALSYAKVVYERYKSEARLVITKRLHCALPCAAAGIPVIFARTTLTKTLMFLDQLMKIYQPRDFHAMDWENIHQTVTVSKELKQLIFKVAILRLQSAERSYLSERARSAISLIHSKYNRLRDSTDYMINIEFKHIASALPVTTKEFCYSFYGAGNEILTHYWYMRRHYPNAKLTHIYDKYSYGQRLYNLNVEPIDAIADCLNDFCIVTAVTPKTREDMFACLRALGKKEGSYA
ncbi:MAG: hypothetical protein CSA25_04175 [Desulfobacter postgatei]|uniref:Polysaccharide pyruvyl transferase domain-containing protein n=1 Tax=Desulfobacter postgatei TaxID=2293 RepID=A0A2G6MRK7_9BACT|nr:MAG: hypothetical protein CSA25_04175 [Desulfobacter postgatei]